MFGGRRTRLLWLIRCGENEWDAEDRLRGDEDLPLTPAGEAATREAVERASSLPFPRPAVIHHPLDQSAVSTARLAAKALGSRRRGNDELADPALGVLAGITLEELRERFERRARQWEDDPSSLVPPDGEPFQDARVRLIEAGRTILHRNRTEAVGIVVHDLAAGFLRTALAGLPEGNPRRWMEGRARVETWAIPEDVSERLDGVLEAVGQGEGN
ncbi:MAG: histidine phosphatase family protein [Phycisphaera sp. TMED9]|nr:MAG: histidine phosphatase family protein [Phycisphaera sp. TMED9]